ncbi:Nuclear pore complex protein NUP1-like protein [Drosera capensis]
MSTAAGDSTTTRQSLPSVAAASSYDGGAGGKFRKKPFRRHQSTPYDRRPTAVPRIQRRNGWLARIVDPTSKIIASGAHRLFASVFRKRLLPPPTSPQQQGLIGEMKLGWVWYVKILGLDVRLKLAQSFQIFYELNCSNIPEHLLNSSANYILCFAKWLDANQERRYNQQEAATMENIHRVEENSVRTQESLEALKEGDGIATLEQILREKNFTRQNKSYPACINSGDVWAGRRDELDHLTGLLLSRTIDTANGGVKEISDKTHEENHAHHSRDTSAVNGPLLENPIKSNVLNVSNSTPALGNVFEEDMASPVHLAKAYMASKSAKVSPSMLGLRNQTHKEQTPFVGSPFQLQSPSISLPSKHPNSAGSYGNNFLMPRSRGKTVIYSMPRSPYSRVQTSLLHKGSETAFEAGPSTLSQNVLAVSQWNEPKKSALKRRISVFDNDIGSVGPIRRIRQKPNLLSPRSMTSRIAQDTELAAAERNTTVQSAEDDFPLNTLAERINMKLSNQNSLHHPSKSVEMGQRILQQLDRISPKEKPKEKNFNVANESATELIPTMLGGQASRSLEIADTSKSRKSFQLDNKQNSASHAVEDIPNSSYRKVDKNSDNVSKDPEFRSDKLALGVSVEAGMFAKASQDTSSPTNAARKFDDPPKKNRSFQMSAYEDHVELEEDMLSNGDISVSFNGQKKDDSNVISEVPTEPKKVLDVRNPLVVDGVVNVQKNLIFSEVRRSPILVSDKNKDPEHPANRVSTAEDHADFTFPAVAAFPNIVKPAVVSQASRKEDAAPQFNAPPPVFVSPPSFTTGFSSLKGIRPEISNSVTAGTSTGVAISTLGMPDKIDDYSGEDAEKASRKELTPGSSSAEGLASSSFSVKNSFTNPIMSKETTDTRSDTALGLSPVLFSSSSTNQSFSNGFTQSSPSTAASAVASVAANGAGSEVSPIVSSSSDLSATFTAPSLGTPIFKFGNVERPAASTSQASVSFVAESTEPGHKRMATAHDSESSPSFSAPLSIMANANSGFFGFEASTSENGGSLLSSSKPAFNSNPAGSSSMTFSLDTSTMSASSGTTGTLGSSWQSSNPQLLNSAFNSSVPPFTFGASSSAAVAAVSSSAPMVFGATGAPSSPVFSFANTNGTNPVTPSLSSVGNTNSMFTFGLTPPNNGNVQMNMDSMAEDSVQVAAPSVPAFCQSPMAAPPSSGFVFGATPSPMTNPFQFGGQPNLQVPAPGISPFQPSGSLESNPGSFSLGTGGNDKSNRRFIKVRKTARKR